MEESTKDKIQGKVNDLAGKAKEAIGNATNNPDLHDEGKADQLKGKIQEKVGDIKKVFEK